MSNLRFPKVFVMNQSMLIDKTKSTSDLANGQIGIFNAFGVGATGGSGTVGSSPTKAVDVWLQVCQNVGDVFTAGSAGNGFGTIKSKPIHFGNLKSWYVRKAAALVNQVTHIGTDGVTTSSLGLTANCGEEYIIPIHIYSKTISKYYSNAGYHTNVLIKTDCCAPCSDNCDLVDQSALADLIVGTINGTLPSSLDYAIDNELQNYVTAAKVGPFTNSAGAVVYGVSLTAKNPALPAIPAGDPGKVWENDYVSFKVGKENRCANNWNVYNTTIGSPAVGSYNEVRSLESESQGYDRVRENFGNVKFNSKTPFVSLAAPGTTYDFYHLLYDYTHSTGNIPATITEPYEIIFAVPTLTGDNSGTAGGSVSFETYMNAVAALNGLPPALNTAVPGYTAASITAGYEGPVNN